MNPIEPAAEAASAKPNVTGLTKFDRVNRWLTLAANIGVMLGLVILIVEVRQSANLARVTLETEKDDAQLTIELHMTDPAVAAVWEKSIRAPDELTIAELRVMDGILTANMMIFARMHSMMEGGLVDRVRVERGVTNMAPFFLGSPFGKNWWQQNAVGWQGTAIYDIADPIIREVSDDFLQNYYASLRVARPAEEAPAEPPSAGNDTP